MSTPFAISVETRALFTALDGYPKILGIEISKAMRFSFRRLIDRLVKWTPPIHGRASVGVDAQKAGAAAIRRDIMRIVFIEKQAVLDFWQEQNGGTPFISRLTLNRKGTHDSYTLTDIELDPAGRQLDSLHRSVRNSRGRVPSKYRGKRLAVTPEAFSNFLEKQLARSGQAKGGWIASLAHFGGSSPAWIARHASGNGSFVDHVTETLFTLEATNTAKSIGSLAPRLIASSLRAEAGATLRDLERAADNAAYRSKLITRIGNA